MGFWCDVTLNWLGDDLPEWFEDKYWKVPPGETFTGPMRFPCYELEDDLLKCMRERMKGHIQTPGNPYCIQVDYVTETNEVYRTLITPSLMTRRFEAVGWRRVKDPLDAPLRRPPNVLEHDGGETWE